jgi:hypothetical protein
MLERSDASARRAGIDRRRFLHGFGGVAAALAVYNLTACSSDRNPSATGSASGASSSAPGGVFSVPQSDDVAACQEALSGNEFIFDVHTHHVMPDRPWVTNAPSTVGLVEGMLPAGCVAGDPLECVNRTAYLHSIFLGSDTTVALLSDVPNSGPEDAPVPFADAVDTQQLAASLTHGGASRLLVHNVIAPNVGDLQARLDGMTATAATGHVAGFKVYTAWGPDGRGFALDDPAIGLPVVQHAHDLGVRVFTSHKGLPLVSFDAAHNGPNDIVAVSRIFPDMQFVVFHGAWDSRLVEGPFNPSATRGIDSLLAALDRHNVPPNDNVWVDLGSVWRQLLTSPNQAARARQAAQPRRDQPRAVGHRRRLVRLTAATDHGVPHLRDHRSAPRAVRLPRADLRREGASAGPQRSRAVRDRPHRDALRPRVRSALDGVVDRRGAPLRRCPRVRLGASGTDDPPGGAAMAGLARHPLDAELIHGTPGEP